MSYKRPEIPISERPFLTISEASSYFNINANKLIGLLKEPDNPFVIKNGRKMLVKREVLYDYMMKNKEI